jgi:hypothetical protein
VVEQQMEGQKKQQPLSLQDLPWPLPCPMQITATRRHVDFHIGPILCDGHPWRGGILLSVTGPSTSTIGSGPDGRPLLPDAHLSGKQRTMQPGSQTVRQSDSQSQPA